MTILSLDPRTNHLQKCSCLHKKVDPLKRTIDFPDIANLAGENEDRNDHEDNILSNNNDVLGSAGIYDFDGLIKAGSVYAAVEKGEKESRRNGGISEEPSFSLHQVSFIVQ